MQAVVEWWIMRPRLARKGCGGTRSAIKRHAASLSFAACGALSVSLAVFLVRPQPLSAQKDLRGEIEIRLALEKLETLGSAMMIGAHPDDENTALIAWLARWRHVRTSYLSLT